jgi:hypothetical protein
MARKTDAEWFLEVAKYLQSGQLRESINQLTQSVSNLNHEISGLNVLIGKQSDAVSESAKRAKENVDALSTGFKNLNQEMAKSNSYFERIDKSGRNVERLTAFIMLYTVFGTSITAYIGWRESEVSGKIMFGDNVFFVGIPLMVILAAILIFIKFKK